MNIPSPKKPSRSRPRAASVPKVVPLENRRDLREAERRLSDPKEAPIPYKRLIMKNGASRKSSGPMSKREFRATMNQIDADLKQTDVLLKKGKEADRKIAPKLRALLKESPMATKISHRPLSAKEHDATFRATTKRINIILKRMDDRAKKSAPLLRELRKIAGE